MLEYRAEGLCRNANHLSREELSRCIAGGECCKAPPLPTIPTAACGLSWAVCGALCPLPTV